MKKLTMLLIIFLSVSLVGCANTGFTSRQQRTAAGALVGGVVGYGLTGSGIGAAAGAVGGGIIGNQWR